ncbi:TRAP transporter small permease [Catenovulum agarivorans]|uniref:TRAP transporter small permease n=1 Tax=Catenovulum agarivorans TaxID=1172192 RepID=UPI00030BE4B6|nr:TRAP transporter small permease [Catenovulum agarivorans]
MWNKIEKQLTALLLLLIVILVFLAALMRTFGQPIIWSVDIAQLLFAWVAVLGANQALRQGSHAKLDVFQHKLTLAQQIKLTFVLNLFAIGALAVLIYYGVQLVQLNPKRTLGSTELSYAWVTAAIPVGASLMATTLIVQCLELIKFSSSLKMVTPPADLPLHIKALVERHEQEVNK